jgi:hypothetical protein
VWAALARALGGAEEATALARREPSLLCMAPAAVERNLAVMRGLKLTSPEIRRSIQNCPRLFLCNDYAGGEMQGKLLFVAEVLGRPVRQVLANQPHLLMRSLAGMECKVGGWAGGRVGGWMHSAGSALPVAKFCLPVSRPQCLTK